MCEQSENDCHIQSHEVNTKLETVFSTVKKAEEMDHKCIHHFLEIIQHIMSLFDVGARKRPLTKRLVDSTQKIISEYIKQMMFELPGIPNTKAGLIAQ